MENKDISIIIGNKLFTNEQLEYEIRCKTKIGILVLKLRKEFQEWILENEDKIERNIFHKRKYKEAIKGLRSRN